VAVTTALPATGGTSQLDPVDADPLLSVDGVGGLGSRVVELGAPLTADHSPTEFTGTE